MKFSIFKRIILFLLAIGIVQTVLECQSLNRSLPTDTLARIGSEIINGTDFLERFELMPWPQKENKVRLEYTKLEFLYSMIAEKLLAYEAKNQGLDRDSTTQLLKSSTEKLFSRDELYKREVSQKTNITARDVQSALNRFAWELTVEVMGIMSSEEGTLLYKHLQKSSKRDSVLEYFRDSLYTSIDTVTLNYGGVDIPLEDAAYPLKMGEVSKPFLSAAYGTVMVRLLHKYSDQKYISMAQPDQITHVEKIIRTRKEDVTGRKFFGSVLGPQRAEADQKLFAMLADSVYALLMQDSASHRKGNYYFLGSQDIAKLSITLSPHLGKIFIVLDGSGMTLAELLENLNFNQIVFPGLQQHIVDAILNNNIKTVVQNELLARNALRKNLNQSQQVRHDVGVWMDNRLSGMLSKKIIDTVQVSEKEIMDYYRHNAELFGAKVEVNIREILIDSLELAQELRKKLLKGESMLKLAEKYSLRKEWAARSGESGFFPITEHGDIGFYASSADSGTIVGPIRVPEGFSIFSLIERKQHFDSTVTDFESVKGKIRMLLLIGKREKVMSGYIGKLAKMYDVRLYEDNLRKVKTTTTNMFTWRHIGFGGRVVAVPGLSRHAEWYQEWRKKSDVNP